ncbi:exopolygalacturonase [Segetibacter sp. 3557_3]|uniref:glycoside hydrolase family 28 protein n=1 Tax=Segetibacter sp. 3557_3 TaxID=2547429 RepID=UPI001058A96E|nr:glycosyl hydrolase family 28 protein [Segetibacter sp. 3557_3]TDH18412.1 exopolygalacturonase [Segetibacter sp. 3557_3]
MRKKLVVTWLLLSCIFATRLLAQPAKRYDITKYGATGDAITLNTPKIQAAIDACANNGGGTLVIPKGVFLTGSLFLKRGVNIEMLQGAVLKGSTNIKDYPKANTRIEGHFEPWPAALLNGDRVDSLRITGPGTFDGSGEPFWKLFYSQRDLDSKTTNLNVERPRLTFLQNSKNVSIKGIHFKNSGFWNLHMYRCKNVVVDSCQFTALNGPKPNNAPSSDGIDVDCSQDVTIKKCFFSVGDDCIALKGTKGPFALQDTASPPVERVRIEDCVFEAGGGIVTFGSEATIVRDVYVERCTTRKPTVLRLKLRPDTPQQYENVFLNDITLEGSAGVIFKVDPWTQYFDLKGQPPPRSVVRNIIIANVKGSAGSFGKIVGHPLTEISNIVLKNVDVKLAATDFELSPFEGLKFDNVIVNGRLMTVPAPNATSPKAPSK